MSHIAPSACSSRLWSILPLEVGLTDWCICKVLRSRIGSLLHGHGHLKVFPIIVMALKTSDISVSTGSASIVDFEEAKGLELLYQ